MLRSTGIMILLALLLGPGDEKKNGRKGNALYVAEQYPEAVEEFRLGVSAIQEEGPGPIHSRLLNNLGASLYRTGEFEQAGLAFANAAQMATEPDDLVRASYNAGNSAANNKKLEEALAHYRRALISDPSNEDAKFNYEFVKRQLEEQQQQDQQQDSQNQDENKENQENQESQDQQEGDQEKEQQNQEQQQQDAEQEGENQNQDQQQQEQPDPKQLSKEEAQRILEALENEEEQLLRQVQKMKARPRRVEKDW